MRSPVLCVSDPHFHNFKQFGNIMPGGMNSRLWHTIQAWKEAVQVGLDAGCKILVCSGDMFHVRGHLRPSIYNEVCSVLADTADRGMKVVIIPGNHDLENYYDQDTAVDQLHMVGLRVYVLNTMHPWTNIDGWQIVGIPYHHNPETFKERYEKVCSGIDADIVLTHEYFDEYTPVVMGRREIDVPFLQSHIKNTAFVVNGHQHAPEYIPGSRVLNVGAPLAQNFGDISEAYGCWILHDGKGPEFHPLSGPKFLTIDNFKKGSEKEVQGNYVRVQAKTDKAAVTIREKCMAAGALGVIATVVKDFAANSGKSIKIGTKEKMVREYIDIMGGEYATHKTRIMETYHKICT